MAHAAVPDRAPPFARQSFTVDEINPFLPEVERARLRTLFRTYRDEGLFTPPSFQGTIQIPGSSGGANWGSAAVNPAAGTLFIVSKEMPALLKLAAPEPAGARGGASGGGSGRGAIPPGPAPSSDGFTGYLSPFDSVDDQQRRPLVRLVS